MCVRVNVNKVMEREVLMKSYMHVNKSFGIQLGESHKF